MIEPFIPLCASSTALQVQVYLHLSWCFSPISPSEGLLFTVDVSVCMCVYLCVRKFDAKYLTNYVI